MTLPLDQTCRCRPYALPLPPSYTHASFRVTYRFELVTKKHGAFSKLAGVERCVLFCHARGGADARAGSRSSSRSTRRSTSSPAPQGVPTTSLQPSAVSTVRGSRRGSTVQNPASTPARSVTPIPEVSANARPARLAGPPPLLRHSNTLPHHLPSPPPPRTPHRLVPYLPFSASCPHRFDGEGEVVE